MKLWIVIYIFTEVGASVGPLPYDMKECKIRVAELKETLDKDWISKNLDNAPEMIVNGKRIHRKDIKHVCIYSENRPK